MHREGVRTAGRCQDRRLQFNDTITYRCVNIAPHNPTALPQLASPGPYSGKVVDFTNDGMVGMRADGWWGDALLMGLPGV